MKRIQVKISTSPARSSGVLEDSLGRESIRRQTPGFSERALLWTPGAAGFGVEAAPLALAMASLAKTEQGQHLAGRKSRL